MNARVFCFFLNSCGSLSAPTSTRVMTDFFRGKIMTTEAVVVGPRRCLFCMHHRFNWGF